MLTKLTVDHLVPGAIVMVGPSKRINDRSWTDAIWRIDAVTGGTALCKRVSRQCSYSSVIFMQISEHDWFAADHVLDAYRKAIKEAQSDLTSEAAIDEAHRRQFEKARDLTAAG